MLKIDRISIVPSARWIFGTKNVAKLMKEYEDLDVVAPNDTENFLSPIEK